MHTVRKIRIVVAASALLLIAAACSSDPSGDDVATTSADAVSGDTVSDAESDAAESTSAATTATDPTTADTTPGGLDETVAFAVESWPTDWTNTTIDLSTLLLGIGRSDPRDAIPPIDTPAYETVDAAAEWLEDREPGAVVQVGADARFFPLSIMTRHEIVNDEIGGIPLAITYCPLCNTAIAFDRRVGADVLRFGVSGLLRNSDLVMWDDKTTSLWQQITGEAIVGEFAGTELEPVSTAIVSFADFRLNFPDGQSLSRETGFSIAYGANPYQGYSSLDAPFIPVAGETDDRFPALERVVGVSADDIDKAYPFSVLSEAQAVNDTVGEVPVAVLWGSPDTADALDAALIAESEAIGTAIALSPIVDDQVLTFEPSGDVFVDTETSSTWTILGQAIDGPLAGTQLETVTHRNEFWFAWNAFFPEADVFSG